MWRVLLQPDRVFTEFRGRFAGKSSPVHFFWGAFDLAAPSHDFPGALPRPIRVECRTSASM